MMAFCPNMDCHPGCGNDMAQTLLDAMLAPVDTIVCCPHCGTEMVVASRMEF